MTTMSDNGINEKGKKKNHNKRVIPQAPSTVDETDARCRSLEKRRE